MDAIEILKDLARRPLEAAEGLRDSLTPELLNAHPGHDNSIAWLLWHAGREIDEQVSALSGEEPVWTALGFDERFDLGTERHELGFGQSGQRARSIVVDDVELLYAHLEAVVDAQLAYLDSLTAADLDDVIDENWDPPVTRAARLVSVSEDALQHVGQAAYVAGMRDAAFIG